MKKRISTRIEYENYCFQGYEDNFTQSTTILGYDYRVMKFEKTSGLKKMTNKHEVTKE